jgi:glucose dehydrogenase
MKRFATIALLLAATPAWAQVVVPGSFGPQSRDNLAAPSFNPVTNQDLTDSDEQPHNWLHYSGNYYSQRYTRLDQVNATNADQLEMQWAFQLRALDRAETTPLVVDGVMFVTEAPSNVIALDARTGEQYWRYNHPLPEVLNYCCGRLPKGRERRCRHVGGLGRQSVSGSDQGGRPRPAGH